MCALSSRGGRKKKVPGGHDREQTESGDMVLKKTKRWRRQSPPNTHKSPPGTTRSGDGNGNVYAHFVAAWYQGKEGIPLHQTIFFIKHGVPVIPVSLVQAVTRPWQKKQQSMEQRGTVHSL